jgi:drug/metabolite transporter (DMT)-like permease
VTSGPWSRTDVLRTAVLVVLGAGIWVVGWFGVSGRPALEDQIPPMNLAVLGFAVTGAGYAAWFLAGRRAVGARSRALLRLAADLDRRASSGRRP